MSGRKFGLERWIVDKDPSRFDWWIGAWIELAEVLVKLVTFANILPGWSFIYTFYITKRSLKRRKARVSLCKK